MSGVHRINVKHLSVSLAISLGVGILSGLLSMGGMDKFDKLAKPPLTPPGVVFPIVWFILFTLMGISAYLVFEENPRILSTGLIVYAIQLAVNFVWPLFFFNMQMYLTAFFIIIALWLLIIVMIKQFYKVNKTAGLLQIPYLLWVTFAAYLNFGVYLLN